MRERTGAPWPRRTSDLEVGRPYHHHGSKSISKSMLTTVVQDKLGPFTTEETLLINLLSSARKKNIYLAKISGIEVKDSDIKWPV